MVVVERIIKKEKEKGRERKGKRRGRKEGKGKEKRKGRKTDFQKRQALVIATPPAVLPAVISDSVVLALPAFPDVSPIASNIIARF